MFLQPKWTNMDGTWGCWPPKAGCKNYFRDFSALQRRSDKINVTDISGTLLSPVACRSFSTNVERLVFEDRNGEMEPPYTWTMWMIRLVDQKWIKRCDFLKHDFNSQCFSTIPTALLHFISVKPQVSKTGSSLRNPNVEWLDNPKPKIWCTCWMGPEFCHVKPTLPSICNSNFQRTSLNLTLTEAPRLGFWQLGHLHPSCLGFFLEGKRAITGKPYISWHKYWFAQTFFHENSWNQTNESCGQWAIPMFTSGAEYLRTKELLSLSTSLAKAGSKFQGFSTVIGICTL